jgi:hypothetical protein
MKNNPFGPRPVSLAFAVDSENHDANRKRSRNQRASEDHIPHNTLQALGGCVSEFRKCFWGVSRPGKRDLRQRAWMRPRSKATSPPVALDRFGEARRGIFVTLRLYTVVSYNGRGTGTDCFPYLQKQKRVASALNSNS